MVCLNLLKIFTVFILSLSLLSGLSSAPTQAKERRYYIYGDQMPGTKFREELFSSPLPLDKAYSELSKKQKAYVRAPYEGMLQTESPPFPKKGYGSLIRPLVKAHSKVLRNGHLTAIALVGPDGEVKKVELLSTPNKSIGEFVTTLLFATQFDAADCAGKACAMEYLFDLNMRVRHGTF